MRKSITVAEEQSRNFAKKKYTVGLDLGDRWSWYCVLEGRWDVVFEHKLSTTPKARREVFGAMPQSRAALEEGDAFAAGKLVNERVRARSHRGAGEQGAFDRGKPEKDDRLDPRTLARRARIDPELLGPIQHRSARAQADWIMIRDRAGRVGARTGLINAARGLTKSYGERLRGCSARNRNVEKGKGLSAELQVALEPLLRAIESLSQQVLAYNQRLEQMAGKSYPEVERLKQVKGVGTLIALAYVLKLEDPRRFAKSREAGCYVVTTGAAKFGQQYAAAAHQQGRRSLVANLAGAGSATHLGTVWRR